MCLRPVIAPPGYRRGTPACLGGVLTLFALVAGAAVAAPPTLERVGDEVFLGRSLSGAECRLRLLVRGRKPQVSRLGVFCTGRRAAAGEVIEVARRRASPAALASDSDWQRRFAGVLACGEVRMVRILGDVSAALRRCTALDGGWPNLVLETNCAGRTYLMTGIFATIPLIASGHPGNSVRRATASGSRQDQSASDKGRDGAHPPTQLSLAHFAFAALRLRAQRYGQALAIDSGDARGAARRRLQGGAA